VVTKQLLKLGNTQTPCYESPLYATNALLDTESEAEKKQIIIKHPHLDLKEPKIP